MLVGGGGGLWQEVTTYQVDLLVVGVAGLAVDEVQDEQLTPAILKQLHLVFNLKQ